MTDNDKMYGVYCLKDCDGAIRYIGKGKMDAMGRCKRWTAHTRLSQLPNTKKHYKVHAWMASNKGWTFSWLETGMNEETAYTREREAIEACPLELLNEVEGGKGMTSERSTQINATMIEQTRQKALREWQSPARREQARQRAKELWNDPEWAAIARANSKNRLDEKWKDPEWAEKRRTGLRERARKMWNDPTESAKRREQARKVANEQWKDPIRLTKRSEQTRAQMKLAWSDPIWSAAQRQKIKDRVAERKAKGTSK